jgi:hypothetical protein
MLSLRPEGQNLIISASRAKKSGTRISLRSDALLHLWALVRLIEFGRYISAKDFPGLLKRVRDHPARRRISHQISPAKICSAIDLIAIFHHREIQCLQRSAATTCLLRDYGFPARMLIGARTLPFRAHAWVEVAGAVVNDKVSTCSAYEVLERC